MIDRTLIALLVTLCSGALSAQIVTDTDTQGSVQAMKIATIFRTPTRDQDSNYDSENPGYQELLLQYHITLDANAHKVGYLIPVPAEATGISIKRDTDINAVANLHADTLHLAREQWRDRTRWVLPTDYDEIAPRLEPLAPVGDFKSIGTTNYKAIQQTGAEALSAIRAFFEQEGVKALAESLLRWHLKNDWKFVCVVHTKSNRVSALASELALPPIRIGFNAFKAYLPTFNLIENPDTEFEIALISDNSLRDRGLEKARRMFGENQVGRVILKNLWRRQELPEAVTSEFTAKATQDKHDRWQFNLVRGQGFDHTDEFAHNFGIAGGIVTDEIPGFWYYGDDTPPVFEGFFRRHGLAVMLSLAGLFLLFITKKMIKDARRKSTD
ncbi:hypothetical protein OAU50_08280 [Planctomycetota bacterium]|nr:hypothetical protein [Planctomycetota bacterium]